MSIRDWFYHRHYWGIPHRRAADNRMIQICYECGKEREVRMDLTPPDDYEEGADREGFSPADRDGNRLACSMTGCCA